MSYIYVSFLPVLFWSKDSHKYNPSHCRWLSRRFKAVRAAAVRLTQESNGSDAYMTQMNKYLGNIDYLKKVRLWHPSYPYASYPFILQDNDLNNKMFKKCLVVKVRT